MFSNGYAWVWANGEAGYLSEDGQYTPLYSIPGRTFSTSTWSR